MDTAWILNTVHLDQQELKNILATIEDERTKERQGDGGIKQAIDRALASCAQNLDNLIKLRYRELIRDDEFIRQRAELMQEQLKLTERRAQLDSESWIEPSRNLFLFSNRAVFWLTHGTASEKRLILSTVGSNLSLKSKKLSIDAKKPFLILQKRSSISTWCTIVNDVRTFFRAEPDFEIPLLPEPSLP